jgi:hypothetical protein
MAKGRQCRVQLHGGAADCWRQRYPAGALEVAFVTIQELGAASAELKVPVSGRLLGQSIPLNADLSIEGVPLPHTMPSWSNVFWPMLPSQP